MSILDDNILENTAIDPTKGFPLPCDYRNYEYDWRNPLYFSGTGYELGIKTRIVRSIGHLWTSEYENIDRTYLVVFKVCKDKKNNYTYLDPAKKIIINTDDMQVGVRASYLYLCEIQKNRDILYLDEDQEQTLINCLCTKATEIEQYNKEHDPWYGFKED